MSPVLVVVDLQNDYFPGGALPLVDIEKAAANAKALLHWFRQNQWPVIFIQHISNKPGAFFFLPDSEGASIHSSIEPVVDETIVVKHYPNSFRETDLLQILKTLEPTELVFSGAMSHMCIDATVRAAFDLGFKCTVAADACATFDMVFDGIKVPASQAHAAFMSALQSVYAHVASTRQLIEGRP